MKAIITIMNNNKKIEIDVTDRIPIGTKPILKPIKISNIEYVFQGKHFICNWMFEFLKGNLLEEWMLKDDAMISLHIFGTHSSVDRAGVFETQGPRFKS